MKAFDWVLNALLYDVLFPASLNLCLFSIIIRCFCCWLCTFLTTGSCVLSLKDLFFGIHKTQVFHYFNFKISLRHIIELNAVIYSFTFLFNFTQNCEKCSSFKFILRSVSAFQDRFHWKYFDEISSYDHVSISFSYIS